MHSFQNKFKYLPMIIWLAAGLLSARVLASDFEVDSSVDAKHSLVSTKQKISGEPRSSELVQSNTISGSNQLSWQSAANSVVLDASGGQTIDYQLEKLGERGALTLQINRRGLRWASRSSFSNSLVRQRSNAIPIGIGEAGLNRPFWSTERIKAVGQNFSYAITELVAVSPEVGRQLIETDGGSVIVDAGALGIRHNRSPRLSIDYSVGVRRVDKAFGPDLTLKSAGVGLNWRWSEIVKLGLKSGTSLAQLGDQSENVGQDVSINVRAEDLEGTSEIAAAHGTERRSFSGDYFVRDTMRINSLRRIFVRQSFAIGLDAGRERENLSVDTGTPLRRFISLQTGLVWYLGNRRALAPNRFQYEAGLGFISASSFVADGRTDQQSMEVKVGANF